MSSQLTIDTYKIHHNASVISSLLQQRGISSTGVTKVFRGAPEIAKTLLDAGCIELAESQVGHMHKIREAGIQAPIRMLRTVYSDAAEIVQFATTSHNTEISTIAELNKQAKFQGTSHNVLLMVELGDLREGVMPKDLDKMVAQVLKFPNINLKGIGTNLACANGIKPDDDKMRTLSELADQIERNHQTKLDIISGGNSSTLSWTFDASDHFRINNLRLGEAILLGLNPLTRQPMDQLYQDTVLLEAEIFEAKVKPRQAWGDQGQAGFGGVKKLDTRTGEVQKLNVNVGFCQTDPTDLTSQNPALKIISTCSDSLVLENTGPALNVGDKVTFSLGYSAVLNSMNADPYEVKTKYIDTLEAGV